MTNEKPLRIAVSLDFDPHHGFFLKEPYFTALESKDATIIPVLYDLDQIDELLDQADGVIIPGGLTDMDPKAYGQEKLYDTVQLNERRTEFDVVFIEKALKQDKPLLCICWGMQLLNIHFGGTLYQDLPAQRPSDLKHEQLEYPTKPTHSVQFLEGGMAREVFDVHEVQVNSTHHQAVNELGKGIVVEGKAPDGVIECVRLEGRDFVWGVQWHPERLPDDVIIAGFLKACRR